jgi:hypothetical protein
VETVRETRSGLAIAPALACFVAAYVLVTVLASGLTIGYGAYRPLPEPEQLGVGMLEAPAFVATVPYHVLIMLLVWPLFAGLYFRWRRPGRIGQEARQTGQLAALWLVAAIVTDYVGFVLIDNPWRMTARELYVDYQPWISLIYLSIFASPWIRLALSRRRG